MEVLCSAWRSIFDAVRPDALVCNHAPMALLASRSYEMRRVVIGTGFEIPPTLSPLPLVRYWEPDHPNWNAVERDEWIILGRINEFLATNKLQPLDRLADLYADADATFLSTFPELDPYLNRGPADYCGVGPLKTGDTPEWPDCRGPRLFGYLKPPTPNWRLTEFLQSLGKLPFSCLIYVPGAEEAWLRHVQSPTLRVVAQPVDIERVAVDCNAAILNATNATTAEFLIAGVPILNIPLYLEQVITAHRVVDLGAGLAVAADRPDSMIESLIAIIQNDAYRIAAQAFADKYAYMNSEQQIAKIVDGIETLACNRCGSSLS